MSSEEKAPEASEQVVTETSAAESGLAATIQATISEKYRERVREELPAAIQGELDGWWSTLLQELSKDDVAISRTSLKTLDAMIQHVDQQMSVQLATVMHHPEFKKLEGTWTGLRHLVFRTNTNPEELYIDILNCSKEELEQDMLDNVDSPQLTKLYKKTYSEAYNIAGGVPHGILIGDYEFNNHPDDISTLAVAAKVVSMSHTQFITSPAPQLFGFDSFEQLKGKSNENMANIFASKKYENWKTLREMPESRYLVMAMPRVMGRLPYGAQTSKTKEFNFEEVKLGPDGELIEVPHDQFSWFNAAYAVAERITNAFWTYGWTSAIRGEFNGGKVDSLPLYVYNHAGTERTKSPCEIDLDWNQDFALSNFGFYSMVHVLEKNYTRFEGAQTLQKPKEYVEDGVNASAQLSAGLPYILAASRVAHYLKKMAHDHVGTFKERADCEAWLNKWIMQYVLDDPNPDDEMKASHPFAAAKVTVVANPRKPGYYEAQFYLKPWIFLESLNADITLVSEIPAEVK